jgi:hypothetical protein
MAAKIMFAWFERMLRLFANPYYKFFQSILIFEIFENQIFPPSAILFHN